MKNEVLDDIKRYALTRLRQEYGYCGMADGERFAMLNSGDDGVNLVIEFKETRDEG